MGDTLTKSEELGESKSYSGMGMIYGGANEFERWHQSTTTVPLNIPPKINNSQQIRSLLEEYKNWNESWELWMRDRMGNPPLNADEFANKLSLIYKVEKL